MLAFAKPRIITFIHLRLKKKKKKKRKEKKEEKKYQESVTLS